MQPQRVIASSSWNDNRKVHGLGGKFWSYTECLHLNSLLSSPSEEGIVIIPTFPNKATEAQKG